MLHLQAPPSMSICVCGGCERWESLLAHARLLGIAPNRCDEVKNTFKCRYVSRHDRHACGAEGKVHIEPPPSQKKSDSSTTANVQPTIENVATTYIGLPCKKRTLHDV
jgi:hypothetical protein